MSWQALVLAVLLVLGILASMLRNQLEEVFRGNLQSSFLRLLVLLGLLPPFLDCLDFLLAEFLLTNLFLQTDGSIKYQGTSLRSAVKRRIVINNEVSESLKLDGSIGRPPVDMLLVAYLGHGRIDDGIGIDHLRILIELLLPTIGRFRYREEVVVHAHFG